MIYLLVILLTLGLVYFALDSLRSSNVTENSQGTSKGKSKDNAQMVLCDVCGVYVPREQMKRIQNQWQCGDTTTCTNL